MAKCNIADLSNLKTEERNHYNSRLMCQRCWLLCTFCGYVQNCKRMWSLENCDTDSFFNSTQRSVMSAKFYKVLQNV